MNLHNDNKSDEVISDTVVMPNTEEACVLVATQVLEIIEDSMNDDFLESLSEEEYKNLNDAASVSILVLKQKKIQYLTLVYDFLGQAVIATQIVAIKGKDIENKRLQNIFGLISITLIELGVIIFKEAKMRAFNYEELRRQTGDILQDILAYTKTPEIKEENDSKQ